MNCPELEGLPCVVPFLPGRKPAQNVTDALVAIGRRHCAELRAVWVPTHVCSVRAADGGPIIGAWVVVQKTKRRLPRGVTMRSPDGIVVAGTVELWEDLWIAEDTIHRRVFDLAGADGPSAIDYFYRFSSWAADEDRKKADAFQAAELAAMLASLRARRDRLAGQVSRQDVVRAADELYAAGVPSPSTAEVKEWERRGVEVAPRADAAYARHAVEQSQESLRELTRAVGEMDAPVEVG